MTKSIGNLSEDLVNVSDISGLGSLKIWNLIFIRVYQNLVWYLVKLKVNIWSGTKHFSKCPSVIWNLDGYGQHQSGLHNLDGI